MEELKNLKKYVFRVTETASKVVEVLAENSDEAMEIAFEIADLAKNPDSYECECDLLEGEWD